MNGKKKTLLMSMTAGAAAVGLALLGVSPAMATDSAGGERNCGSSLVLGVSSYQVGGTADGHGYSEIPSGATWGKGFTGGGSHLSVSTYHNAGWSAYTDGSYSPRPLTGCY